ncbi:hypothetical protein T03_16802 [Trichinella britovi]|uniref:Uncharacterized protein n=2 Tax=Trichinella TaxID=6333 RepID=A0A0V1AIS1_TRIBR|nr:hypothetical protein T05_5988 [Trichinella murrelli]KRY24735.1 hypothetical protein T03_16802 [Trichinella britovi]
MPLIPQSVCHLKILLKRSMFPLVAAHFLCK